MILRPLHPPPPASEKFLTAWEAVEHAQRQPCESCWMVTQPSHAALAGELAANLSNPQFPVLDDHVVRAIALHDSGWGMADTQAIMRSRSVHHNAPQSFVAMAVPQFLQAWEKSIETCESVSAAGGYIVSRHFWRLAEHLVNAESGRTERQKLETFLKSEERRQKKLAARQSFGIQQLEELTDVLQFCDLLSLYMCCGSRQNVVFPKYFGIELRVENQDGTYKLDPQLMNSGTAFTVAALRYPATKEESSRGIRLRVE